MGRRVTARTLILGAMEEEIEGTLRLLRGRKSQAIGDRVFHTGLLDEVPVIVAFSRWGKVAATGTLALGVGHFAVERVIFLGIAGGLGGRTKVGDIVVATELAQHDLDARPLFPRYEVPLAHTTFHKADRSLVKHAVAAAKIVAKQDFTRSALRALTGRSAATVHRGLILSGDQFIGTKKKNDELASEFPNALAVEMEGAAVAQLATEVGLPFAVVRVISDDASENAHVDFVPFVKTLAVPYLAALTHELLKTIRGSSGSS